ncbi:MAG: hypothetical protein ABI618_16485, partial [Nitrospirota bacterium]
MVKKKFQRTESKSRAVNRFVIVVAVLVFGMTSLPPVVSAADRLAFVVGIGTYDNFPSHHQLK